VEALLCRRVVVGRAALVRCLRRRRRMGGVVVLPFDWRGG
jgi:hypothetical protein